MSILMRAKKSRTPRTNRAHSRQPVAAWMGADRLRARAVAALLWCVVATGPAAFVVSLALASSSAPVAASAAVAPAQASNVVSGRVGDVGLRWVLVWLGGDSEERAKWFPPLVGSASPVPAKVSSSAVVSTQQVSTSTWSVVVEALVAFAGEETPSRRYFATSLQMVDGVLSPLALPVMVAAPSYTTGANPSGMSSVSLSSPIGDAVTTFARAYLVGAGDLSRVLSPGVTLQPVETAASGSQVAVRELSAAPVKDSAWLTVATPPEGAVVDVLATVDWTSAKGLVLPSQQFAVALKARAGRWEVLQLLPALANDSTHGASSAASASAAATSGE